MIFSRVLVSLVLAVTTTTLAADELALVGTWLADTPHNKVEGMSFYSDGTMIFRYTDDKLMETMSSHTNYWNTSLRDASIDIEITQVDEFQ